MTFMDEWQKIAQTLKTVDIDCHSLCAAIVLYQKSTVHLSYGFIRFQQLVQVSVTLVSNIHNRGNHNYKPILMEELAD